MQKLPRKGSKSKFAIHLSLSQSTFDFLFDPSQRRHSRTPGAVGRIRMKRSEAVRRLTYALSLVCEGSVSVNIRLCDLEEMIEANTRFRGKEGPTDVLSFPAEPGSRDDPGSPSILLGDLLVCVPVCAWQAKRARWTLAEEIEKMIVHGLVHLKGFDHERSEAAWRVMSTLERALSRALREEYGKPEWLQVGGK